MTLEDLRNGGDWKGWALGVLFSILLFTFGLVVSSQAKAMADQGSRVQGLETVVGINSSRITALEERSKAFKEQLDRIEANGADTLKLVHEQMKITGRVR